MSVWEGGNQSPIRGTPRNGPFQWIWGNSKIFSGTSLLSVGLSAKKLSGQKPSSIHGYKYGSCQLSCLFITEEALSCQTSRPTSHPHSLPALPSMGIIFG